MDFEDAYVVNRHLCMLASDTPRNVTENFANSPLLTPALLKHCQTLSSHTEFTQYGLLGSIVCENGSSCIQPDGEFVRSSSRLFYNTMAPSSTFICGSQGSGKSHTLSCLLENCLTGSDAADLQKPLTALVFHYDAFISDDGGSPCEAAFLASLGGIRARVLCSPSNLSTIRVSFTRPTSFGISEVIDIINRIHTPA